MPGKLIGIVLAVSFVPGLLTSTRAVPAADVPVCVSMKATYWPGVDSLMKDCTGENELTDGAKVVLAALEGLKSVAAGPLLKQERAEVFYFRNRHAANEYFNNTWPFRLDRGYGTKTAKCGNTWAGSAIAVRRIAVAVYQHCSLPGSPMNKNRAETALHEGGHADDIAQAFSVGEYKVTPSRSKAFRAEVTADLANDDAAWKQDGTDGGHPVQWQYICGIFSNVAPSELEIALSGGAKNAVGSVCEVTSQGMRPREERYVNASLLQRVL